jgi:hypothetical protein
MIWRVVMTVIGVTVPSITGASASATREWNFSAYLDDEPIGHHRFVLTERSQYRELLSEAELKVKFLAFTAYRYTHTAREEWNGDCLTAIHSETDDNGKHYRVAADSRVSTWPNCVMSFAYWNPSFLKQRRLLNAQTGEYVEVKIDALGDERITVRDQTVAAQHYRLKAADFTIEVWYADGEWVALDSITAGGRRLRYRL